MLFAVPLYLHDNDALLCDSFDISVLMHKVSFANIAGFCFSI